MTLEELFAEAGFNPFLDWTTISTLPDLAKGLLQPGRAIDFQQKRPKVTGTLFFSVPGPCWALRITHPMVMDILFPDREFIEVYSHTLADCYNLRLTPATEDFILKSLPSFPPPESVPGIYDCVIPGFDLN
jgi:hypothetical protein